MAEYIDKQAAIEKLNRESLYLCDNDFGIVVRAENLIYSIPAADVRPVRRGKWTRIDYEPHGHDYKCSACGWKNDMPTHFCPNCGADMREKS